MSGDHHHHPYSCRRMTEQASAFLDGTLDDTEWAGFKAHLEHCPPCGEYIRQIGLTIELLRRLHGDPGARAREELLSRFRGWQSARRP